MGVFDGHGSNNDDLLAPSQNRESARGGEDEGYYGGNGGYVDYSGKSGGYTGGWDYTENGIPIPKDKAAYQASIRAVPSARAQDVNRYRGLGEAAANRGTYQIDYGDAREHMWESEAVRGSQSDALNLARAAAMGGQPSQAQLLGQQMTQQSLDAQMAGAASARGGSLAQAAAMRQAQVGSAQFQQQAIQQGLAARAAEMAHARDAYMGGASTMRGMDFQAAGQYSQMAQQQAQLEMAQRQLNQQGQMGYEQMAIGVNNSSAALDMQRQALRQGDWQFAQQQSAAERDRTERKIGAVVSAGSAGYGQYLTSQSGKSDGGGGGDNSGGGIDRNNPY
jgi:hypothetical protein